ncbi:hypothetical protein GPJ56_000233 [Histomonas meleagridis]|uniref:uncharacterized protein n=1 Tax=Histomonas meleagridis TaxID=135588 RepID=UPI003559C7D1|nr:hypothetical protein GPJ56_000233 [Histomonas meleagridis]KAH0799720.1 hypothetical protein GO595_007441 [Histomonas meleagridis]
MIEFKEAPPPKLPNNVKNSRRTIANIYPDESILYTLVSTNKTEIQLVKANGETITVISFNAYMDIVSADLSPDFELVTYTERISGKKENNFAFRTTLCQIHSFERVKVVENANPIHSFFLEKINFLYQIVTIIGSKITHHHVSFVNKKIRIKQYRNNINLAGCMKWFYCQPHNFFFAILSQSVKVFKLVNTGAQILSYPYNSKKSSLLPTQLALMPTYPSNLPHYRFSRNICYCLPFKNDFGIIEQLYSDEFKNLTFSVSTVVKPFSQVYEVEGVDPGLPLNFMCYGLLVFPFVVNSFIYMINFSNSPPSVHILPKVLAKGPSSNCTISIGTSNYIVDIVTRKTFLCNLSICDIKEKLDFSDKSLLHVFATIYGKLPQHFSLPWLLNQLPDDIANIRYFINSSLNIGLKLKYCLRNTVSKHSHRRVEDLLMSKVPLTASEISFLNSIDADFPSAGPTSRVESFYNFLVCSKHTKIQNPIEKGIQLLSFQNRFITVVRQGLDEWKEKYKPSLLRQMIIYTILLNETEMLSTPAVPCLKEECQELAYEICTDTLLRQMEDSGLIDRCSGDARYWTGRLGEEDDESVSENGSHSSESNWRQSEISNDEMSALTSFGL